MQIGSGDLLHNVSGKAHHRLFLVIANFGSLSVRSEDTLHTIHGRYFYAPLRTCEEINGDFNGYSVDITLFE